jgi:hypothetical protein
MANNSLEKGREGKVEIGNIVFNLGGRIRADIDR